MAARRAAAAPSSSTSAMRYWCSTAFPAWSRWRKSPTCCGSGRRLERFYARLEDEYELKERADVLTRKLTVISDSAKAFADIIDTERSLRLELIIVVFIAVEIVIAGFQLWAH